MGQHFIQVTDIFTGDHPAAQFEQGTKQECGTCGCNRALFSDALIHPSRSWGIWSAGWSIATIAKAEGPRAEARGVTIEPDSRKSDLQQVLDNILHGVIRVPSPILHNPFYEVVASEPLHDLKGQPGHRASSHFA